jgi:hypothetical protein
VVGSEEPGLQGTLAGLMRQVCDFSLFVLLLLSALAVVQRRMTQLEGGRLKRRMKMRMRMSRESRGEDEHSVQEVDSDTERRCHDTRIDSSCHS